MRPIQRTYSSYSRTSATGWAPRRRSGGGWTHSAPPRISSRVITGIKVLFTLPDHRRRTEHQRTCPLVQPRRHTMSATVAPPLHRSESQILRSLLENGVGKTFDLNAWSHLGCAQATATERLEVLLEQVRPDVAKLIVLEELEVRHA